MNEQELKELQDILGPEPLKKARSLLEENIRNYRKWWDLEQKYILPCFGWAKELGLDLEKLVRDQAGKNCVELFVAWLRERAEAWRNEKPIDLLLNCPKCGKRHLDVGEFRDRVHRKHLCENTPDGPNTGCGHLWVPHWYATRGVTADEPTCVFPTVLEDLRRSDAALKEILKALASPRVCGDCGKVATCIGSYEGGPWGLACDDCCGHGNEDGRCFPLWE